MSYLLPLAIYLLVLLGHRVLPAREVAGYVRDENGQPLRYRLNGLFVFGSTIGLWVLACRSGLLAWDFFYTQRWPMAIGACLTGLVFSAAMLVGAKAVRSLPADFYLGRRENPRAFGVDAKMYLYLAGATMLGLNLASFAAHHVVTHVDVSPGVLLHTALFGFFLVDYLWFEEIHLYTYDLFAERVGFKLGWGCLVFYPFFYACGLWAVADRPNPHSPAACSVLAAMIFFSGWFLSRGANLQKFLWKTAPGKKLLGVVPQQGLGEGQRTLLVSGFWGLSRHINYLGEIMMALGLALSLGYPTAPGPWLYPIYYLVLLLPRERDDDRRCEQKYGALWAEYRARVPWRVVPKLY